MIRMFYGQSVIIVKNIAYQLIKSDPTSILRLVLIFAAFKLEEVRLKRRLVRLCIAPFHRKALQRKMNERHKVILFGCGASISEFKKCEFDVISRDYLSIGINYWTRHWYTPDLYTFEAIRMPPFDRAIGPLVELKTSNHLVKPDNGDPVYLLSESAIHSIELSSNLDSYPSGFKEHSLGSSNIGFILCKDYADLLASLKAIRLLRSLHLVADCIFFGGFSCARNLDLACMVSDHVALAGFDLQGPYFWDQADILPELLVSKPQKTNDRYFYKLNAFDVVKAYQHVYNKELFFCIAHPRGPLSSILSDISLTSC